jgi:mono/diheme cytochrome c family protein
MKLVVLRFAFTFTAAGFVTSNLAAAAAPQGDSSARRTTTPAAIYGRKCASCHGKDGRAQTIKGKLRSARNLTDPQWQNDVSDERIYNSIMNGRGKMPRYASKLSEADINSLVTYVRGLKK